MIAEIGTAVAHVTPYDNGKSVAWGFEVVVVDVVLFVFVPVFVPVFVFV